MSSKGIFSLVLALMKHCAWCSLRWFQSFLLNPLVHSNACALALVDAVKAHTLTFMLAHFASAVDKVKDAACKKALMNVCLLFGCYNILESQWAGLLDAGALSMVRQVTRLTYWFIAACLCNGLHLGCSTPHGCDTSGCDRSHRRFRYS